MTANARKRMEALQKLAAARIAEAKQRARAAEQFAKQLQKMTAEERAEIKSIQAYWHNTAKRLGLQEPLSREASLTVLRNTPAEVIRYSKILAKYKD